MLWVVLRGLDNSWVLSGGLEVFVRFRLGFSALLWSSVVAQRSVTRKVSVICNADLGCVITVLQMFECSSHTGLPLLPHSQLPH